jgi:hypothetical protein
LKNIRFFYLNFPLCLIKPRAIKKLLLISQSVIFFLYVLLPFKTLSQVSSPKNTLLSIISRKNNENTKKPIEKLYLQFDKPYYAIGDTLWFKAYLLNSYLTSSSQSGIINVDIANDSNKIIKRYRWPAQGGLSRGNINLDEKEFTTGTYTICAYTNWMRNFNDDYFFYKSFYIIGNTENFAVQQKATGLAIIAKSDKDKSAAIPITLNPVENADVQFLPEGGSLVAGLPAHVGFKAVGKNGRGLNVSGIIIGSNQKEVVNFQSTHNGMGSFDLAVKDGESYTAKVTLPSGAIRLYSLPATKSWGTVLQVKSPIESDSLEVSVWGTNDLARAGDNYFLIGKARGIVCYAAIVNFHDARSVKRKIAKNLFPTGITHFTIITDKYQPLNERMIFIEHHDNLNIQLNTDKDVYTSRDSVALQIKVTDNKGNPEAGSFSLAVTDDQTIKNDTLNSENIITRILLTSDLKGYIEQPGYYLSSATNDSWQALDNLLLTQGWIGYNWRQIVNPPAIIYQPETEFMVTGSVSNVFNKPVKGTNVILFSKSPSILMDTVTDKEGKFIFHHFPKVDTPIFVLKAVNKNGRSFNVGIKIDEQSPPVFNKPGTPTINSRYVNGDTTLLNYAKSNTLKQRQYLPNGGHILKEVKISAKKIIKGSRNVYGVPNIVIDEKDLEKAGKKSFLQLLEENVKGFHETVKTEFTHDGTPNGWIHWYFIGNKSVFVLVDGIFLHTVYQPFTFDDFSSYLKSHNAEDIRGIEVMSSINPNFVFIEITTRSGHGPVIDNTPGMYLYRPLPISWPKQFYKPKYTIKDTANDLQDLRSTIDWEPNIITDNNGNAMVYFYTSDKPSTYTLIIEGSDMNGSLGYKLKKITINKAKATAK